MKTIDDFQGKVVVITGGASGIGRGIAETLALAGATTVVADIDLGAATRTAEQIGAVARQVDVRSAESVEALAQGVHADLGRIDVVVNNAGVGPLARFADLTLADFAWVFDINVWGVVHGLKAFLPLLLANPDGGCVVNVASVAALIPAPGATAYAASKAAVVAISDALAVELALEPSSEDRIGVYVLMPALVHTNINAAARTRPGQREGDPGPEQFLPPLPALEPVEVGRMVLDALRTGRRYVLTHAETTGPILAAQDAVRSMLPAASGGR